MQNAILTHINFYLAKPRRVGNGIVENVRIRNEPCITMTEVFLRFTGQATISYTQLPQLTLFPRVSKTREAEFRHIGPWFGKHPLQK